MANAHLPQFEGLYIFWDKGDEEGLECRRVYADPAAANRSIGQPCKIATAEPLLDAGGGLAASHGFRNNDDKSFVCSFASRPDLEATMRTAEGKDCIRVMRGVALVLRTPAATKKATYEGQTVHLVSRDVAANTVTVIPDFPDGIPIEGTNAHKRVLPMNTIQGLKLHHLFPPPPPPPPVAASGSTVQEIKVGIYKDTILTRSGEMQYRLPYWKGVPIREGDELATKCARFATARDQPADFSWGNHQVLLDGNWYPLAFFKIGEDEVAVKGMESALKDLFCVQLNEETGIAARAESKAKVDKADASKDKVPYVPPKPVYAFYGETIKLAVSATRIMADLCRQRRPDELLLGQIDILHELFTRLMRRRGFPITHPSAKDSMTPIWAYRDETRANAAKRGREEELGLL